MGVTTFSHSNILVRTPCEAPDLHLYREAKQSGATPFLDLGRHQEVASALKRLCTGNDEGIRIHLGWDWTPKTSLRP